MVDERSAAALRANVCSVYVRIKWLKDAVGAIPATASHSMQGFLAVSFHPMASVLMPLNSACSSRLMTHAGGKHTFDC